MSDRDPLSGESTDRPLSNCEREPIHIPGAIQPFGILIALSETLVIENISLNVEVYTGVKADSFLGMPLGSLFSKGEELEEIERAVTSPGDDFENPYPLTLSNRSQEVEWEGFLHRFGGQIFLETEPRMIDEKGSRVFDRKLNRSISRIQNSLNLSELCHTAVAEIQKISGYDRVMIYRFDENWNGEVLAEALSDPSVDSYLGHHFPSSDIPPQARAVFLANWIRVIPDVNYQPSPIIPTLSVKTNRPLDLSRSFLRSVSPIHIQYLKNMPVGGSMTISLISEGKLWGLIACHHEKPHLISTTARAACKLIGKLVSSLLWVKGELDDFAYKKHIKSVHAELLRTMTESVDFIDGLVSYKPNLLDLVGASGSAVAVYLKGEWRLVGKTPSIEQVSRLAAWVSTEHFEKEVFATDALSLQFPEAEAYKAIASGLLAVGIPKASQSFIFWFRPEVLQSVTWAGNPHKQVETLPDGSLKIEPRASFDGWKEVVQNRSLPWKKVEIEAVTELKNAIIAIDLHRQYEREKKTRLEIQREKEKFQTIANAIPQMVWINLADGTHEFFNERWHEFTGRRIGESHQDEWSEIVHPDDREARVKTWKHSLETGTTFQTEFRLKHVSGEYRWVLARALPMETFQSKVSRWLGTCTDIQEQKLAEQKLVDVLESMSDGFISVDKHGVITRVNSRHLKTSVFGREETVGKNLLQVLMSAPETKQSLSVLSYEKVMIDRVPFKFEEYNPHFDLWTQVRAYPTPDGGMAVFFTDTTAQNKNRALADIERRKFEAIFFDAPAAMALLKREASTFVYEKTNQKYQALIGNRLVVGKNLHDALPELEGQPFHDRMEKVFSTGETFVGNEVFLKFVNEAGEDPVGRYLDFTYSRVLDGKGIPYGIYIHAVDNSEKVLSRMRAEELTTDLNSTIRARDEFLSIASHELKTPLAALKLQSQLFQRNLKKGDVKFVAPEKLKSMAEQTDRQVTRLTRLVDDMLDIARIRSGKLQIEREVFDACELVKETVERMRAQFSSYPAGLPKVEICESVKGSWDKLRIEQVVANLLTNALRYGKGKPVVIRLTANSEKSKVKFEVIDQGIGIAESNYEKIFDRFERISSETEISGLGLGLFITKQIVESHGGKIWVESELNRGSTFCVELPCVPPHDGIGS